MAICRARVASSALLRSVLYTPTRFLSSGNRFSDPNKISLDFPQISSVESVDSKTGGSSWKSSMMNQMLTLDITSQFGSCMPLSSMRIGTHVHNIELRPGQGGKLVRAAAKILTEPNRATRYCEMKLASGAKKVIDTRCRATIGMVSNPEHGSKNPPLTPRTRTPLEKQFESWLHTLKPGFTESDVDEALRAQSDPDLALDIFRWISQQRSYKHTPSTYLTMIDISVSGRRYRSAETLIEQVIAGACPPSLPLFNAMIKFCCCRFLFNRAFDIYKKMVRSQDAKPNLETYALLLNTLLRKFEKLNVCYVYLPAVRSLSKQMKASGVIPDTFVLNMIIKAYSKCREVDDAIRVFREMGLYGCEPNGYTYSYLTRGLCEKGLVCEGLSFYREMRGKGLVPKGSTYLVLICSLAMERKFEEAIEIAYDMLGNSMSPDLLTYKTLLGEMCRDGRGNDAFELLEGFRKRDSFMNEKVYSTLMNGLHFLRRDL